jgi:hypothetical protein
MDQHPLRWFDRFAETLAKYHGPPVYVGLARLTSAYLDEARRHLAEVTGLPRPAPQAEPEKPQTAREKTCADPDDRPYVPGIAPSW